MYRRFLRLASEFEALAKTLNAAARTEQDKRLVEVAEGMVKVCELLAEHTEKHGGRVR